MNAKKSRNITFGKPKNVTRRGGVARPLGPMIGAISKRAFGRRGFSGGEIVAEWARVVGDNLATLSEPDRITYPQGKRSGGTLHLRIESGSIAVELQHLEPVLLERINGYFGYKAVERVRLIQAPLVRPPQSRPKKITPPDPDKLHEITRALTDVEDPDLRQSLENLAAAILRREGRKTKA